MPLLREFSPDSRHTRYTGFLCRGCFSNGCVGRVNSFGDGLRSMGGSTSTVIRTEYQVCVGHCGTTITPVAFSCLTFCSTLSMQLNGGKQ